MTILRSRMVLSFLWLTLAVPAVSQTSSESWSEYMPLALGQEWTFIDEIDGRLTIRVEAQVETGGESCWHLTWSDEFLGAEYQGEIWCPRERGLALVGKEVRGEPADIAGEAWLLTTPMSQGTGWGSTLNVKGVSHQVKGSVLGPRTVETPAGRFNAVLVRTEQAGSHIDRWFVRGVGLVREEMVLMGSSMGVKRLAEIPSWASPPADVLVSEAEARSAEDRTAASAEAAAPESTQTSSANSQLLEIMARAGVDREQLEEIRDDEETLNKLSMTVMMLAVQTARQGKELREEHDLSTPEGIREAAPGLAELAAHIRAQTDALEDPRIRRLLEPVVAAYEDLPKLAEEDPERAAVELRKRGISDAPRP